MTASPKEIGKSPSFIAALIFGAVGLGYTVFHLNDHHDLLMFSFLGDVLFVWIPLLICYVIGVVCLFRYLKKKQLNDIKISLLPVLFTMLIILLGFFKAKESANPVLFQVSNGETVGGLALMLKTDNVYTQVDIGGVGYSWCEGKYTLQGDTLLLKGQTEVIDDRLIIRRDSAHCPVSLAYRVRKEKEFHENELQVVFDSLFCKKTK